MVEVVLSHAVPRVLLTLVHNTHRRFRFHGGERYVGLPQLGEPLREIWLYCGAKVPCSPHVISISSEVSSTVVGRGGAFFSSPAGARQRSHRHNRSACWETRNMSPKLDANANCMSFQSTIERERRVGGITTPR